MSCLTKTYHRLHTATSIRATSLRATRIRLARARPPGVARSRNPLPLRGLMEVFSFLRGGNLGVSPLARAAKLRAPWRGVAGKSPRSHISNPSKTFPLPATRKNRIPSLSNSHNDIFYYSLLLQNPLQLFAADRITFPYTAGSGHHWTSTLLKASQPSRIHREFAE